VSILNSPTGQVIANAIVVSAGTNGGITVEAAGNTDLVIDINGYYTPAPAGPTVYTAYCIGYTSSSASSGLFPGLGANSTIYCFNGADPTDTSGGNTGAPITSSGLLKNLWVISYCTPPSGGSTCTIPMDVTVQVWINSVATPLTCKVTMTAFNKAFKCADTTDVVPVSAGDALSISNSTTLATGQYYGLRLNVSVEKQ
jgi:hypothetical protein